MKMFRKFPDAQTYIDIDKITKIEWFKRGRFEKHPYAVSVYVGEGWHVIESFETEEQAESYSDKLAAELNGNGGVVFTKDYLEKNTDKFVIDGKEYYYCDVSALFEKDDEVFAVVFGIPRKVYSAKDLKSANNFIEDFATFCPHLKRIKGTRIFFEDAGASCACIDADNTVYVVIDAVVIEVGQCVNLDEAENYCNKLRDEYGF